MEQIAAPTPVAILMATYNGEPYLSQQLDSLLSQTYQQWTLYIHDDGSTDKTMEICHTYARQHPNIIILDYESQGGARANFLSLLQRVEASYYLFCDQDDVWLREKIALQMERMATEEREHPGQPIVVYSDLAVVDADLQEIAPSFLAYQGIRPEFLQTFAELGAANLTTGCTMLFNREAKALTQIPAPRAAMHDAWVTLSTARAGGILALVHQPLVRYRQHGHNTLGAVSQSRLTPAYRIRHFLSLAQANLGHYRMLRALGYGSWLKLMFYKIKYRYRLRSAQ
ncbi:MAG: glycosyltransferase family 2 protein [Prevotella sp.]|nr:glycosyltransferase family 2 protein [Prevotella sp.]